MNKQAASVRLACSLSLFLCVLVLYSCSISKVPKDNHQSISTITSQGDLAALARSIEIKYQVIDNLSENKCHPSEPEKNCFTAQIRFLSPVNIEADTWQLYFSHVSPIRRVKGEAFVIEHINGDLHRLTPGTSYSGFSANQTSVVEFSADNWHLSKSDIMPNYYLVSGNLRPEIIPSTIAREDEITGLSISPHAEEFSEQRQRVSSATDKTEIATSTRLFDAIDTEVLPREDIAIAVIPSPVYTRVRAGHVSLKKGLRLEGNIPSEEAIGAALRALVQTGLKITPAGHPIRFEKNKIQERGPEAYHLVVTKDEIFIQFTEAQGASLALRTLAALMFVDDPILPLVDISDYPRFEFRGLHLDVARNFRDKNYVIKLLEQMARYKLNRLHLHLADDEGWRLEIPTLPELTQLGAKRCHDLEETRCLLPQLGSGPHLPEQKQFYSQADYSEILREAKARHIEVIPSFDMPGHSRAAVVAMEARFKRLSSSGDLISATQYRLIDPNDSTVYSSIQHYHDNTINVCLESTYRFVEEVVDALILLHRSAGAALKRYHIGADETAGAWIDSPVCKNYIAKHPEVKKTEELGAHFVQRVANMLANKNIVPAAWSDGLAHTSTERMPLVQSNAWTPLFWDGHNVAHEQLNRGWEVVLSTPDTLYFDFPYAADPEEPGYYWASRATNSQKVFSFMPQNLPANAELLVDRRGQHFRMDDKKERKKNGFEFIGMQGHLWSETVQTDTRADYMLFPRVLALAERAWHKADWELDYADSGLSYEGGVGAGATKHITKYRRRSLQEDWNRFANILGRKELEKLDRAKVFYRIPPAAAKIADGRLNIKSPFPGLAIEYQIADEQWQSYTHPVKIEPSVDTETIQVRLRSPDATRAGRAALVK